VQKPAPVQAQSKPEPVKSAKSEPVKSAKTEPVKSAKSEPPAKAAQPPAAPPKPAPAPSQAAAPATKEAAPVKPVLKAEKAVEKKKGGGYCLLVGDYGPGKPLDAVLAKLKKSGITPVQKKVVQAVEPMNRLFVAEFGDQDSAEAELQKLRKLTGDAFLLPDNGKYILYAGSYLSSGVAASEMKRLASRGVTTVVRQSRVTVKVTRVAAGNYAGTAEARSDAARLKKLGIAASLVKSK
jgi:cell division protein FtsN